MAARDFHGAAPSAKPPLSREELRDVIDLALWAGQMLLEYGAETDRVEETVHRLGTGLGLDWMDILVSPNAIVVTTISGEEFRSKVRRVVRIGVDMTRVTAINALSRHVESGDLDRAQVRGYLQRVSRHSPHYNRWLVVLMVGVACVAFGALSGSDWEAGIVIFVASTIGMILRNEMLSRVVNPFLLVTIVSFVASLIASLGSTLAGSETGDIALVSSVLILVPGVPLISAAADMLKGHMVTGMARGLNSLLTALAIALGMMLALWLVGGGLL